MTPPVPALSIVTPTFNAIRFIERCLDNVRDQHREDVEHLIVDGGSTDGTRECVLARARVDSRVRLLDGPDRGQAHAMNKGVVAALAPTVGILNVDDSYMAGTLALAIARLATAPQPSFFWGACEVHVHGPALPSFLYKLTERRDEHGRPYWIQYPGKLEAWRLSLGWDFEPHPLNPAAYFYHRSLHFVAGLYEEENHYAMDLTFIYGAARHLASVISTQEVLGRFNLDAGCKTYDNATGAVEDTFRSPVHHRVFGTLPLRDRTRVQLLKLRWRVAQRLPGLARLRLHVKRFVGRS